MTASATDSVERMMPVPWQCGHCVVEPSSTPVRIRWRDISSRPKWQMRPTWMRARSMPQRILQAALDLAVVALLLHVDEVDDDQAGEVAQLQLARDLVGRLEVGVERRLLDRELARRLAGVDVDGDQRLGLVDDDDSRPSAGARRG